MSVLSSSLTDARFLRKSPFEPSTVNTTTGLPDSVVSATDREGFFSSCFATVSVRRTFWKVSTCSVSALSPNLSWFAGMVMVFFSVSMEYASLLSAEVVLR